MSDASPTHQHVRLTFPPGPATDPVIYQIITRFSVVPNIRRASIQDHTGWMVLDLGGEAEAVESAIAYMESIGVDVSRVEGDVLEG
jgi:ABC-type methionine transport system ATPase subunit